VTPITIRHRVARSHTKVWVSFEAKGFDPNTDTHLDTILGSHQKYGFVYRRSRIIGFVKDFPEPALRGVALPRRQRV